MIAVVYYHAYQHTACADGLTAAAITREALAARHPNGQAGVICLPIHYGQPAEIPDIDACEGIWFVDYCPTAEQLEGVLSALGEHVPVTICDHHASQQATGEALAATRDTLRFFYASEDSGASLVWHHFHPGQPMPALVEDVRDIDLWHWQRPHSYGVSILISQNNSLRFAAEMLAPEGYAHHLATARAIGDFHMGLASQQARSAMLADVRVCRDGDIVWSSPGRIPVLATDETTSSLAVSRAARDHQDHTAIDIAVGFHTTVDKHGTAIIKLSVRGLGQDSTLPLTQSLGGGGHYSASGARASRVEILADENRVIFHA